MEHRDLSLSNPFALRDDFDFTVTARLTYVTSPTEQYLRYEGELRDLTVGFTGGDRVNWRVELGYRNEDRLDETTQLVNDSGQNFHGFRSYSRDSLHIRCGRDWDHHRDW